MERKVMSRVIDFGKIAFNDKGIKRNAVTIEIELRRCGGAEIFTVDPLTKEETITGHTPTYVELSIRGDIWNATHTDIICGGQCLDTINEYRDQLNEPEFFDEIYSLWKNYHLNGMHAGTPEQEAAIAEWKADGGDGNEFQDYNYNACVEYLKQRGLYEVNFTGLTVGRRYENEPYRYGTAWVIQELPGDVLLRVDHIIAVGEAQEKEK